VKSPFNEIEENENEPSCENVADENMSKKERPKFYVVERVVFVANNQKELREYFEENEPTEVRILKGYEVIPKVKKYFSF
jgi:hypothetical protein